MEPGTPDWLAQVVEEIVDPEIPIVDPHHHLWPTGGRLGGYELDELRADTGSGHNIVKTAFVECRSSYRPDGPEHLRPIGETEYVAARAAALRNETPRAAPIAAIVAHADLRDHDHLDEVLDAHEAASDGLLRGIRHAGSWADEPEALFIAGRAPQGLYADEAFRAGVRRLGERGLPYDTWHYHYQNREFLDLARAEPDTVMVLDHLGTPCGVGRWAGRHDEIFPGWCDDMAEIAACENVMAKLGGIAMPDNGFGWDLADRPPTSDAVVAAQRRWYEHMLDCFGPDRCMFESNFPVDKRSLSYAVFWNAAKKLTAELSPDERTAVFSRTAERVYRI